MSSQLPRTRYSLSIALLACLVSHSVMAATLPGDQDLIRERQNRLLEDQQRRLEQLKELPGKEAMPEAPAAPVDSRCFPIQTIELQGAEHLPVTQRERLLKPYTNQCLGVSQLNALLKQHEIAEGRTDEMRARKQVPIDIDIVIYDGEILRPNDYNQAFFQKGWKEIRN